MFEKKTAQPMGELQWTKIEMKTCHYQQGFILCPLCVHDKDGEQSHIGLQAGEPGNHDPLLTISH